MNQTLRLSVGLAAALALGACDIEQPASPAYSPLPSFANDGFVTPEPLQAAFGPGYTGTMKAIATVDDQLPGGEYLAGTLDGIGIWGGQSQMNLAVTHELSVGASPLGGTRGCRVSYMTIDTKTLSVLDHYYPVDGTELYMYVARNSNEVLRGKGRLYVFTADDSDALPNDVPVGG